MRNTELLDVINSRTSYRGEYLDTPVSREDLTKIMEAGLNAPSGCNKQTVSLIGIDDQEIIRKINALIDPPVCETAPAIICVLSQKIIAYRDRCFSIQDYSAAIENMLLAIKALGYESCWYEGHITDVDKIGRKIGDLLEAPEDYDLVCVLPVGVAKDKLTKPKKKSFSERASYNGFKK